MLEAHRSFVALLAQLLGQAVEQVRSRKIAHHTAALAADLVQVPVQQQQDVVDRNVLATLVEDGHAVGITVHREAEIVVPFLHLRTQQPQRLRIRSRRPSTEQRIVPLVDERHPAARLGQHRAQRELANAVHRIDNDLQPSLANLVEVDQCLYRVHVFVGEVALLDDARLPAPGRVRA